MKAMDIYNLACSVTTSSLILQDRSVNCFHTNTEKNNYKDKDTKGETTHTHTHTHTHTLSLSYTLSLTHTLSLSLSLSLSHTQKKNKKPNYNRTKEKQKVQTNPPGSWNTLTVGEASLTSSSTGGGGGGGGGGGTEIQQIHINQSTDRQAHFNLIQTHKRFERMLILTGQLKPCTYVQSKKPF